MKPNTKQLPYRDKTPQNIIFFSPLDSIAYSYKGRNGTDPWPTRKCLDIFPTPQRLQSMPFIACGGARLGHVCSRLFSEILSQ